jgi:hypothetical protein
LSNALSVLAAQIPNKPNAPTTTFDGLTVTVSWQVPFDGATEITGYEIVLRQ